MSERRNASVPEASAEQARAPAAPRAESSARFFDAIAGRYERVYAPDAGRSRVQLAKALRELPDRARVLDLGVGTGRELSALLDAGHEPVGLDISPRMLEACARRARPVPLVLGDLWGKLPFRDGAFDAALALFGTLAHPPSDDALARFPSELARVLRSGGVFVAEVPSPAWLHALRGGPLEVGDFRLTRTADDRMLHEDRVVGVAIEARVLSPERWQALFGPAFAVRVDAADENELFIVATRR